MTFVVTRRVSTTNAPTAPRTVSEIFLASEPPQYKQIQRHTYDETASPPVTVESVITTDGIYVLQRKATSQRLVTTGFVQLQSPITRIPQEGYPDRYKGSYRHSISAARGLRNPR